MDEQGLNIIAVLLVSLRLAPTFAFAFPFTLLRVPATIRVLLSLSLAVWLVQVVPQSAVLKQPVAGDILYYAFAELLIGIAFMLTLQWTHAAILMIGRAVDVQTGFGLALLIDPASRTQRPLIGTVFAFAAAAVFFSMDGPMNLLNIWADSLRRLPLGSALVNPDIPYLMTYISSVFSIAVGLAAIIFLTLFLIDMTVALLSRTLPQMNVLLIGFQVKTLAVLATLPLALAYSTTIYIRLVSNSLNALPRVVF